MQLRDIMTPEVERVHKDENLQKAAQRMKTLNVGMISIYDGDAWSGRSRIGISPCKRSPQDVPQQRRRWGK